VVLPTSPSRLNVVSSAFPLDLLVLPAARIPSVAFPAPSIPQNKLAALAVMSFLEVGLSPAAVKPVASKRPAITLPRALVVAERSVTSRTSKLLHAVEARPSTQPTTSAVEIRSTSSLTTPPPPPPLSAVTELHTILL